VIEASDQFVSSLENRTRTHTHTHTPSSSDWCMCERGQSLPGYVRSFMSRPNLLVCTECCEVRVLMPDSTQVRTRKKKKNCRGVPRPPPPNQSLLFYNLWWWWWWWWTSHTNVLLSETWSIMMDEWTDEWWVDRKNIFFHWVPVPYLTTVVSLDFCF